MAATATLLAGVTGCGDMYPEVVGAYEGSAELFNATNFGMITNTEARVITVTTLFEREDEFLIGLAGDCALVGKLDGDTKLTVASQTCNFRTANADDAWTYEGSAEVSEEGVLTLELEGTFSRVYDLGPLITPPPLEGIHSLSFKGSRR